MGILVLYYYNIKIKYNLYGVGVRISANYSIVDTSNFEFYQKTLNLHIYCFISLFKIHKNFKIPSMNEFGHFITYPDINIVYKNGSIQLNHYWSKAYDEYISKRNKGT